MLSVVHFLRSFFKVRDVISGPQSRVCFQSFVGVAEGTAAHAAAPWAVYWWLRGIQERSAPQSQLLDVLDLEVVACQSVAFGTAGRR